MYHKTENIPILSHRGQWQQVNLLCDAPCLLDTLNAIQKALRLFDLNFALQVIFR